MAVNLAHKFDTGLSPEAFIEGMTQNKEAFQSWYDQFKWENDDIRSFFSSLNYRDDLRCLILASDWCGDVVRNIPVVFQAMQEAGIPTEVLIMEENLDVMDQFLTMGGRSIPIVIFTDTGGAVLAQWGPRPKHIQEVMVNFKQNNPDPEAADYQEKLQEARKEIMARYGEGTGYQAYIIQELRDILSRI